MARRETEREPPPRFCKYIFAGQQSLIRPSAFVIYVVYRVYVIGMRNVADADVPPKLLVCRPELDKVDDFSGAMTIPYDKIRERLLFTNADLEIFIKEETEFDKWSSLRNRIQAVTSVDSAQPPSGQRLFVPEAIFFHPLWIKHQTEKKFGGWSRELFNDVTADNALEKFKTVGQQRELDIRPVDGLLEASFVRNVLHEVGVRSNCFRKAV